MTNIVGVFCLCMLFFSFVTKVSAQYVLPYPSYMPGNKLYRISRIADSLKMYWHWGNIAKIKYYLGIGDKYLVESKTLFEYKQYLLASDALVRSDQAVGKILPYLQNAAKEGKDIKVLQNTVSEAMLVHQDVIAVMKSQLPEEFVWRPEKSEATTLTISSMLDHALDLRQSIHDSINSPVKSYSYDSQAK